jgi:hypothetical protein
MFVTRKSAVNLFRGGPAVEELVRRVEGEGYGLVVLDTLRRMSGGADGNGSDMGVVIDRVDRIRQATDNGSVLVISHTDKGDTDTRGYSGIEDDADIVWHAKRDEDNDSRLTIECAKMKDGPDGERITLRTRQVLNSLVIDAASRGVVVTEPEDGKRRRIFEIVQQHARTGITAAMLVDEGFSKTTVYRALNVLCDGGEVLRKGAFYFPRRPITGGAA